MECQNAVDRGRRLVGIPFRFLTTEDLAYLFHYVATEFGSRHQKTLDVLDAIRTLDEKIYELENTKVA